MPSTSSLPAAVTAAAALICAAPLQAVAQDAALTGDELRAAWADKEISGRTRTGTQFWMTLKSDGSASLSVGSTADTGQWRTVPTGYCAKWTRLREGREACFTVRRSGDAFVVFNDDGSENGRVHRVR